MRSYSAEEISFSDGEDSGAQDEKIFVSVRVRPMNAKESAKNDTSVWECVSNDTIIYKNSATERSNYPNAYTFGKQYSCGCKH